MMMRRFSLYKRGRYYYCQFWNSQTGKYASGSSTRQTNKNEATATVATWLAHGLPQTGRFVEDRLSLDTILTFIRSERITQDDAEVIVEALKNCGLIASATVETENPQSFFDYLDEFWDYERSPYVREKIAHNQSISRRTCYDRGLAIKNYWRPLFPTRNLSEVTKADLRDFSLTVAQKVSAQTVNHIMNAGSIALRWAYTNDLIQMNPAEGIRKFTVRAKKRDVLSTSETQALGNAPRSERCRCERFFAPRRQQ